MRFCLISTFYPPYSFGGDGAHVRSLAEMLSREGHEVEVIHCEDSFRALADEGWAAAARVSMQVESGIRVHRLESGWGTFSPAATYFTGRPLLKSGKLQMILDRGGFDVIHFHNISLIGGPAILRMGNAIKLFTLHEHWLICPTHTLFKFGERACDERECLRCAIHSGRPPQPWRYTGLVQQSLDEVDAVLCPSRSVQRKHEEAGLRARYVHMPSFAPVHANAMGDTFYASWPRPYFLFVGRLEKLKGLQNVIPLFGAEMGADLLVAGEGGYQSALKTLAGDNGRVHFLGQVARDKLAGLYAGATAVVVPSLTFEVMPLVILEALAQRTPVVVRDLGPLPDLVRESGGGVIFRTEEELSEKLRQLLDDAGLRDQFGAAGHDYSRRQWSESAYRDRYCALIETLRQEKGVNDS